MYQEVLLFLKILQTKPQDRCMKIISLICIILLLKTEMKKKTIKEEKDKINTSDSFYMEKNEVSDKSFEAFYL